jgi:hypothetical protein
MGNPNCPEPNCHRVLRLRHLVSNLGIQPCPHCRGGEYKKYILTPAKEGLLKCSRCKKDYAPKRREGYGKYFVCKDHPWQKFKVGAEVIMCKSKPKTVEELKAIEKSFEKPQQAQQRRRPNVQMRRA